MRCDGSLLSPLHLAIMGNNFLMMFPPVATWTRAVGLRGLLNIIGPPRDTLYTPTYFYRSDLYYIPLALLAELGKI